MSAGVGDKMVKRKYNVDSKPNMVLVLNLLVSVSVIVIGLILFLDEIWMFFPGVGSPGWLIGDWSQMHVNPYHHWIWGIGMVIVGIMWLFLALGWRLREAA